MLRIVTIGGKLQGLEVAYLGKEAGFEVIIIDKNPHAPASKLCSDFICADITSPARELKDYLKTADMIIPALENDETLEFIVKLCDELKIKQKLAFDLDAYKISSSKIASDLLFHKNNMPAPRYYPGGNYPYIAKPSGESGSHGVVKLESEDDLKALPAENKNKYVIQEFLEGPSYSVEIIGRPGNYRTYILTEILVDDGYDCNSVTVRRDVDEVADERIRGLAVDIAEMISLKGIMDLEVILCDGQVKILEIDARFPSQTPIVVFHASGMNYIKELFDIIVKGDFQDTQRDAGLYGTLIHYLIDQGSYASLGEHIMVEGDPLEYTYDITDHATVLSDHMSNKDIWRCTFIYAAKTSEELASKEEGILNDLNKFLAHNRDTV